MELRSMDESDPISNSSSSINIMRYEAGFAPILLQTLASSKRRVKNDKCLNVSEDGDEVLYVDNLIDEVELLIQVDVLM